MLTWVCGRTSCQPSELASPLSTRFITSDLHCQDMPCSHWYTHSWWAIWTTTTRSLPEWPEIFSTGCSPFWTPPVDSCFWRGNLTESRRCFANCTGWRFLRGSSTGYAYWPTGACTTPCRHTSPSRSNWQLMWMVDDVSELPAQWRWSFPQHVVRRSATVCSQLQPYRPGTPCHWTSKPHRH